jgi:hypothetical protein
LGEQTLLVEACNFFHLGFHLGMLSLHAFGECERLCVVVSVIIILNDAILAIGENVWVKTHLEGPRLLSQCVLLFKGTIFEL